jgi:hypothetical protein
MPTDHETSHNERTHQGEDIGQWLSAFEALLRRYSTVSEAKNINMRKSGW